MGTGVLARGPDVSSRGREKSINLIFLGNDDSKVPSWRPDGWKGIGLGELEKEGGHGPTSRDIEKVQ